MANSNSNASQMVLVFVRCSFVTAKKTASMVQMKKNAQVSITTVRPHIPNRAFYEGILF